MVSVIVPCYNYGKYLAEALNSVLSQTYTNWECFIVNDGSLDNTEEVALEFTKADNRFIYIYQKKSGHSAARNNALKQAKGKFIQFLDADDFIESDKLLLQVSTLDDNPNIDFIYSSKLIFTDNENKREYRPFDLIYHSIASGKNEVILNALVNDNFFLPGCSLFRTEVYQQVGDLNETLFGLEDWEYWYRIALLGKEFYYDNRNGVRLMVRDHQMQTSKSKEKMLLARIQAREQVVKIIEKYRLNKKSSLTDHNLKYLLKKHKIFSNREIYDYNIHYGNKILALKALFKYSFFSKQPFYPLNKLYRILKSRFIVS